MFEELEKNFGRHVVYNDKRTQGFSGRWYPTLAAIRQKNAEKFFAQFQR